MGEAVNIARFTCTVALLAATTQCSESNRNNHSMPLSTPDLSVTVTENKTPKLAAGPYGTTPGDRAGPFAVQTTAGAWDFGEEFSGVDNYVFIINSRGQAYQQQLIASSLTDLLTTSPRNVHYFLGAYEDVTQFAQSMDSSVQRALGALDPDLQIYWAKRVHIISQAVDAGETWFSQLCKTQRQIVFSIDALQTLREAGMLVDMRGNGSPALAMLSYEMRHNNMRTERELALQKDGARVVTLVDGVQLPGEFDVQLPSAEELAEYDTLEIDAELACKDHLDQNCPKWDQIARLTICDVNDPSQCSIEIARWITPYQREGRWVTDISPMLAALLPGGQRHFVYSSVNGNLVTLKLRLSNRGKGHRPVALVPLFNGGSYDADYNSAHLPMNFDVPPTAKHVELYALITGHGWGKDAANCAEFCNHTHHFSIGNLRYSKTNEVAGTSSGCIDQIEIGTVPNQYGTWPYGRAGWCPGLDVKPFVADITANVRPGESNTMAYESLFQGRAYIPQPAANSQNNGFGAIIDMRSYVVFWE